MFIAIKVDNDELNWSNIYIFDLDLNLQELICGIRISLAAVARAEINRDQPRLSEHVYRSRLRHL